MRKKAPLKMAVIMDEFTYHCYSPECDTIQVTPDGFKEEIDGFGPDLLFIESVWRGKDNSWRFKLHDNMEDIKALTSYCREKNIPVVFWSKEDPVHFGVFIRTAALADCVFTTDADCVELYKAHLGHDRCYYLPFAAQPATHHPMEEYERQDKFCFAGSFYVKYPERSKTFLDLAPLFKERGLDIYDRNFKKTDSDNNKQTTSVASPVAENYYFPELVKENILGVLPYSEISKAYKGYKYGINMTSMVHSGFMFARRAFELMASNTVTVSNYSRGLEVFFGDLLIATNDKNRMEELLDKYCKDDLSYQKYRLAGLRRVLSEHLYEDRLNRVVSKALGYEIKRPLPLITVVCKKATDKIRDMFEAQSYGNKRLLDINTMDGALNLDDGFVTYFDEADYYGVNYLLDFALATRFTDTDVIGKCAYYSDERFNNLNKAYTKVSEPVDLRRQMIKVNALPKGIKISDIPEYKGEHDIISLDEFNYVLNGSACEYVLDLQLNTGIPIEKIYEYTDGIAPVKLKKTIPFDLEELYKEVKIKLEEKTIPTLVPEGYRLVRDVDDDEIVWLRTQKNYKLSDYTSGSRIGFFSKICDKVGNARCQIEYYDEDNKKLGFLNFALDGFSLLRVQDRAKSFKLIFRLRGDSAVTLKELYASSPESILPAPFPVRRKIFITDKYPSYSNPEEGRKHHCFVLENNMEVIKVGKLPSYLPYSEYEGVQIVSLQYEALSEFLAAGEFEEIVYAPGWDERK